MRLSLIALIFFLVVLPFADMNLIQNPDFGFPILEGHSKVYHEGFPKGWEGIPQMEIVKGERHNKRWAPGVQVCQMSLFNGFGSSVNQKIIVKLDPQGSPVHTLGLSYALREETRTPIWSYKQTPNMQYVQVQFNGKILDLLKPLDNQIRLFTKEVEVFNDVNTLTIRFLEWKTKNYRFGFTNVTLIPRY